MDDISKIKTRTFACQMPLPMLRELCNASILTNKSQADLVREAVSEHLFRLTGVQVPSQVRRGRRPRASQQQ